VSDGPALRCRGLHKRFGSTVAVRALDLEVRRGECFGLLGPNGAGKTTTIEIFEGLQQPDAGEVEVLGLSWARDADRLRPRLGIQLQETALPDKLTVEETVRLFRSFYPDGKSVLELVDMVALGEKRRTQVRNLSGGQRQRLSIARSILPGPPILVFDDSTAAVDAATERAIREALRRHAAGRATIIIAHRLGSLMDADEILFLEAGRIVERGTHAELLAQGGRYASLYALQSQGGEEAEG
jgi:ABC-2 type transport system ATP-binding protein